MISAQTLSVCREEKSASTPHPVRGRLFPDHAQTPWRRELSEIYRNDVTRCNRLCVVR
jgi:hypothetical protein